MFFVNMGCGYYFGLFCGLVGESSWFFYFLVNLYFFIYLYMIFKDRLVNWYNICLVIK